jgi:hypothetical protein
VVSNDSRVLGSDDSRVLGDESAKIVGEAKESAKTGVVFRAREVKNGFYLRLRHREAVERDDFSDVFDVG